MAEGRGVKTSALDMASDRVPPASCTWMIPCAPVAPVTPSRTCCKVDLLTSC